MRKIILKLALGSLVFLIIVLSNSCQNATKRDSQDSADKEYSYKTPTDSITEIIYSVPQPDEILNEIFIEDFELKSGIIAPIGQADQFFESRLIALNLGVYIADLAYLILQDNSLAFDYFKIILKMSNKLELSYSKNPDLVSYIENNIGEKDSLYTIYNESINEIKYELEYSIRNKVLILIYTGSIVETLYLAINNINYNNSKMIKERILEQNIIIK